MLLEKFPGEICFSLQSENGIIGLGSVPDESNKEYNFSNAGGKYVIAETGASFFDSAASFVIIRGGHVDMTVLGALQVGQYGSLASHIIPGKMVPGMGGERSDQRRSRT